MPTDNAIQTFPLRESAFARVWPTIGIIALCLIFITAAVAKIASFDSLEASLAWSFLVPPAWLRVSAILLILLEIVVGVGLVIPTWRNSVLHIAASLVCIFIGYSLWRWLQHIPVPCYCFGFLFTMSPLQSLTLNAVLLTGVTALLRHFDIAPQQRRLSAS